MFKFSILGNKSLVDPSPVHLPYPLTAGLSSSLSMQPGGVPGADRWVGGEGPPLPPPLAALAALPPLAALPEGEPLDAAAEVAMPIMLQS